MFHRDWLVEVMMISVAVIGPDGAGKTTVGRRLEHTLPMPVKYLYMGVSTESSNVTLPTTRLIHFIKRAAGARPDTRGPRDISQPAPKSGRAVKGAFAGIRAGLRLINRLSEEWFRQGLVWYYQWRGYLVIFDRHFFSDYYAYDIAETGQKRSLTRRIHGFILKSIYPKPDLVIYLDAPGEVLFARKGEGTVEVLERRRQDYLEMRGLVKDFAVVDATLPLDQVTHEVTRLICDFYETRIGHWKVEHGQQ